MTRGTVIRRLLITLCLAILAAGLLKKRTCRRPFPTLLGIAATFVCESREHLE